VKVTAYLWIVKVTAYLWIVKVTAYLCKKENFTNYNPVSHVTF
jgi:hypothetical protein